MEKRAEDQARAIALYASSPLLAADPGGRIIFGNAAAERAWGYPEGGMIGLPLKALVSAGADELSTTAESEWVVETEGVRGEGTVFAVELRLTRAEGLLIIAAQDITNRRRIERQMWQALENADAQAHKKSDLLAVLSHEIRNPMGAILGWIEVLRDSHLDADQIRLCQAIERNSNALLTLVNDVLDFCKGEAHKVRLERATVDLHELLAEVAELFTESAARKGIAFDCRVEPRLPTTFNGDARRLRQILINFIGNAVKFTDKGSVRVRVSAEGDGRCRFEIADTGIGIAPEAHAQLFEAFRQASPANYGGSGLGLAICRQLVDLMGGEIGFDSKVGRGTTFWFTVPRGGDVPAVYPRSHPARLRILIAEDDHANQIVAAALVEKLGHQADSVDNGDEAIAAVQRQDYDVVLMDVWMPKVDGLAATRRIAEECPLERRPRVIAVTADATPETRTRCVLAGMIDHITKPLDLERLRYALNRAMAHAAA